MEGAFLKLLDEVSPSEECFRLFAEIIRDLRRERGKLLAAGRQKAAGVLSKLKDQKARLLDLLVNGTIAEDDYQAKVEELKKQELQLNLEQRPPSDDRLGTEERLELAAQILGNLRKVWEDSDLDNRQRLQSLIFPEGLRWDGTGFGAPVSNRVIGYLRAETVPKPTMVTPRGFEPRSRD